MKTKFKIILALTAILSAMVVTSPNVRANKQNIAKRLGYCKSSLNYCGVTPSGTRIEGEWSETGNSN